MSSDERISVAGEQPGRDTEPAGETVPRTHQRQWDRPAGVCGAVLAFLCGVGAVAGSFLAIFTLRNGYVYGFQDSEVVYPKGIVATYYWCAAVASPAAALALMAGGFTLSRSWRPGLGLVTAGCVLVIGVRVLGAFGEPGFFGVPPGGESVGTNLGLLVFPVGTLALCWWPLIAARHRQPAEAVLVAVVLAIVGAICTCYETFDAATILDRGYEANHSTSNRVLPDGLLLTYYWAAAVVRPLSVALLLGGAALLWLARGSGRVLLTAGCALVVAVGLFGLFLEPGPGGDAPDGIHVAFRLFLLMFPAITTACAWWPAAVPRNPAQPAREPRALAEP